MLAGLCSQLYSRERQHLRSLSRREQDLASWMAAGPCSPSAPSALEWSSCDFHGKEPLRWSLPTESLLKSLILKKVAEKCSFSLTIHMISWSSTGEMETRTCKVPISAEDRKQGKRNWRKCYKIFNGILKTSIRKIFNWNFNKSAAAGFRLPCFRADWTWVEFKRNGE